MLVLHNEFLSAKINELGAELVSVTSDDQLEYIWQGNQKFWGRHAPVLFPIVGRLKDDSYQYQNQTYQMSQHGFARDQHFVVESQTDETVTLLLRDNEQTLTMYPFHFELRVSYTLEQHQLMVTFNVINCGSELMYFALGAHPGFNVPLDAAGGDFTNYFVKVAPAQKYERVPLEAPLSNPYNLKTIDLTKPLMLDRDLFKADAQVLMLNNRETTVMLASNLDDRGVAMTVFDAPYLGIWSPYPKEAPFVCLEPWWGIADTVDASGQLEHKFGINTLPAQEQFDTKYSLTFF
ncbi:aldose 1-epimerase family protein [Lentilactobacillus kribbianus]|uniref:aldose 1-epimerase family protein n=1 Tax=Lentilactobacillus kribbianus TaxID=2729622 RepID=UPI001556B24A|nr:aldose 1-epimerase family protein [Lentilactobacillus kribbianus]